MKLLVYHKGESGIFNTENATVFVRENNGIQSAWVYRGAGQDVTWIHRAAQRDIVIAYLGAGRDITVYTRRRQNDEWSPWHFDGRIGWQYADDFYENVLCMQFAEPLAPCYTTAWEGNHVFVVPCGKEEE